MVKPIEHFDQLPYYEQDCGDHIELQFVVRPGSMGRMSAGRVCLEGPTAKALDAHDGWDQLYVILQGEGTVIHGEDEHAVGPGSVVRIPQGTRHGVVLKEGQRLEYVYVNAFEDLSTLKELADMFPAPKTETQEEART